MSTIKHMRADHLPPLWLLKAHIFENLSVLGALKPAEFGSPVIKKKLPLPLRSAINFDIIFYYNIIMK